MQRDFNCPHCSSTPLLERKQEGAFFHFCQTCNGMFARFPVLRRWLQPAALRQIINQRGRAAPGIRHCPNCQKIMKLLPIKGQAERAAIPLDVCYACQSVWLDQGELEALPSAGSTRTADGSRANKNQKREISQEEIDARLELIRREHGDDSNAPASPWGILAGSLGMPVVKNPEGENRRAPVLTWLIGAMLILATIIDYGLGGQLTAGFGFVPAQPARGLGLSWILSFFLHGGIFHLLGNLYFLIVFGDAIEGLMEWSRYLLLIAAGTVLGKLAYMLGAAGSMIPSIGASGGISAIILYYALAFPGARIGLLAAFQQWNRSWGLYESRYEWIWLPAWVAVILWLGYQIAGAGFQLFGEGGVNYLAHLGGALGGALFYFFDRQRDTRAADKGTGFVVATKKNWEKKPVTRGRRRVL